jgi:hypothetical protein
MLWVRTFFYIAESKSVGHVLGHFCIFLGGQELCHHIMRIDPRVIDNIVMDARDLSKRWFLD